MDEDGLLTKVIKRDRQMRSAVGFKKNHKPTDNTLCSYTYHLILQILKYVSTHLLCSKFWDILVYVNQIVVEKHLH